MPNTRDSILQSLHALLQTLPETALRGEIQLKYGGGISHIWMREGWLYLAVVLDMHSRRLIGWAVGNQRATP